MNALLFLHDILWHVGEGLDQTSLSPLKMKKERTAMATTTTSLPRRSKKSVILSRTKTLKTQIWSSVNNHTSGKQIFINFRFTLRYFSWAGGTSLWRRCRSSPRRWRSWRRRSGWQTSWTTPDTWRSSGSSTAGTAYWNKSFYEGWCCGIVENIQWP